MRDVTAELGLGWDLEPLRIQIDLTEVMLDLEPGWQDWAGLEAATS